MPDDDPLALLAIRKRARLEWLAANAETLRSPVVSRDEDGYPCLRTSTDPDADVVSSAAGFLANVEAEARRLLVEEIAAWLVETYQSHRYDGWDERKPVPEEIAELAAEVRRRWGEP